ncbi:MAG TPA: kelch repeat-containing protein, partial [Micromonosporaceae bacterium]|nr:kelch repeat-containing protein [Micromonosporaceae bacterium]
LTVSPATVEGFVPYGESRSTTVTVTNTGTAPAQVEIKERAGSFEILSMQGAQLVEQKVAGLTKAKTGKPGVATLGAAPLVDPAWARIANYPVSTLDNTAATTGGKVYSLGGGDTATERKAYVFDPATESWAALPDMPVGRAKPAAAWVGGKLYVIGGWDSGGTPRASVDVYDPDANAWSTLPATNPKPRSTMGYGVADGKIYLVGGCTNGACDDSADLVIFDPATGSFSTGASYPQVSSWISCGGISDKIYCAGGVAATSYRNGFVYDPLSDSWSPIPDAPLDLWGSSFSSASGLLVLAGGVTADSTTLTNRTVAFDPAANAWLDLPNAQFPRYRGAGACGVYKVGGSGSSFGPTMEAERLGGLDLCDVSTSVDWLAAAPVAFTLGAGKSRAVKVTLTATAGAGIFQPGRYTAQLTVKAATPYGIPPVDVTMNVLPPPDWGKIQGTVLGQPCTGGPVPIPAFVRINLLMNPELGTSLRADAQGRFAWWLPAGTYQVIVAKDNWSPQVRNTTLDAGFVNTVDFTLTPFSGCSTSALTAQ